MTDTLIEDNIHSLSDFIEKSLVEHAEKPAYHCLGQTMTFAQVDKASRALACWLQHHGNLSPGDRIAIQLPNIIQYPIAAYAAIRAGLVLVNTNPLYTSREMQHQLEDSGAKAIIILSDLLPKLEEIKPQTSLETIIVTSINDLIDNSIEDGEGYTGFNDAIRQGQSLTFTPIQTTRLDEVCVLQYTGGTTGISKGAVLTHRNILTNAGQILAIIKDYCRPGKETFICPLPLYHIYAFTVNMTVFFSQGNLNVLIPNPRDLTSFITTIKPFKFTGFAGINTLFVGLCQHPEFKTLDFSALKLTISGGTALTSTAVEQWQQITNCPITEGYGLSETSPVLCLNQPEKVQYGTVGSPVAECEIEIRNENNNEVANGETGQIVARGPQVMREYWQRPQETAKAMTEDGFFKTGDIGLRLPNGYIKIVDRLKDMIIVSGFNVYPNEIEAVLVEHTNIIEAAVIGEQDDKSGERVVCYVTTNSDLSAQEVISHCRQNLTPYKVPRDVIFMNELPKSTVGKILRRELRSN